MDDTAPSNTLKVTSRYATSSISAWILAGLILTTAISLAAAHAPARIRLIGLFSIAFGLLIGWVIKRLSNALETHLSQSVVAATAAILTLGGLIGSTCEIVRLEIQKQKSSPKDSLAMRLIEDMEQQTKTTGDTIPTRATLPNNFRNHLSYRIHQLGHWPSPWPELFWSGEILVSVLASVWISTKKLISVTRTPAV